MKYIAIGISMFSACVLFVVCLRLFLLHDNQSDRALLLIGMVFGALCVATGIVTLVLDLM